MSMQNLLVLTAAVGLTACSSIDKLTSGDVTKTVEGLEEVNETVGRSRECEKLRDMMVAITEENAIGGAIAVNIVGNNGGLMISSNVKDPRHRLHRYINRVGRNLGSQSDRPTLEWTFGVLDTDDFNAYSTPGGYVFVSRGLLSEIDNEAQLAGVLAHEIAHVTERHALRLYSAIKANQCQTSLAAEVGAKEAAKSLGFEGALDSPIGFIDLDDVANIDILGKLVNDLVDGITTRGFAEDDEYKADARAAELMLAAGYDPSEYKKFLAKIPAAGSTHPTNDTRQARLTQWEEDKIADEDPFVAAPGSSELRKIRIRTQLRPIK